MPALGLVASAFIPACIPAYALISALSSAALLTKPRVTASISYVGGGRWRGLDVGLSGEAEESRVVGGIALCVRMLSCCRTLSRTECGALATGRATLLRRGAGVLELRLHRSGILYKCEVETLFRMLAD